MNPREFLRNEELDEFKDERRTCPAGMPHIMLTRADVDDLSEGSTINALAESGEEIILDMGMILDADEGGLGFAVLDDGDFLIVDVDGIEYCVEAEVE